MKTKPNVGDKCFYWDNDGEKVTAIIQSIDADGIVNFGDDMALHWRALHGRVVKKNKACEECEALKNQLSGERFWVGHHVPQIGMLTHESSNLHNYRNEISDIYDHHTEVLVLQTKKSSDT